MRVKSSWGSREDVAILSSKHLKRKEWALALRDNKEGIFVVWGLMAPVVSTRSVLSSLDDLELWYSHPWRSFPHLLFCTSALVCGLTSLGKLFLAIGRGGTGLKKIPALPSLNVYFSAVTSRASWESASAPSAFGFCSGRLFLDKSGLYTYLVLCLLVCCHVVTEQLLQSQGALSVHGTWCFKL